MSRESYYFEVRLLVKHPDIDPLEISKTLKLTADHSNKAGEQRVTAKGTLLEGVYKLTSWSHSWQYVGQRNFFTYSESILISLKSHRRFFNEIAAEGGKISLNVALFGKFNIGDVTTPNFLKILGEMNIQLGIEVFPNWNEAEIELS